MKKRSADGLFKRDGSKYWQCWINGERRSTGYTDRTAARSAKALMEQVAADPKRMAAEVANLKGAVDDFMDYLTSVEKKNDSTKQFYRLKCQALIRYFDGDRKLADLTDAKVWLKFIEERTGQVSRNTVGHELTAAKRVLRIAKMNGAFPADLDEVFPPGFSRDYVPKTRALSLEEAALLIAALKATTPRLAGFVAWEIAAASRWGEVERAERVDVEFDGALVRVRGTKTKKADTRIPIAPMFREMLLAAVELGAKEGPMFGRWCNPSRDLEAACKRAGIPRCTTNDLRRTHAQLLNAEGVDIRLIANVLRHTTTKMAEQVYAPLSPAVARRLLEVANNLPKTAHVGSGGMQEDSKTPRKLECPGSELNRRHEDFQSVSTEPNSAKQAGYSGSGGVVSDGLPAKNSTLDSGWARGVIKASESAEATFGPWDSSTLRGVA